ncbi:MAG TPA: Holliday junction resolvase RuvX [Candidatus Acidoferrales bacterium]|nr:Holliday junction resolvase RuvX [Candidatus Acidoferrales bacterium]
MNGSILGVDLGAARIGIAICEAPGLPAVPLTTIAHTNRHDDIAAIVSLARERKATRIVVGNPILMNGTAGPAAQLAGVFMRELQRRFDGEVIAQDERFTTAAAARRLRDIPVSGSKRRRRIDQIAAVEILDAYLAKESSP